MTHYRPTVSRGLKRRTNLVEIPSHWISGQVDRGGTGYWSWCLLVCSGILARTSAVQQKCNQLPKYLKRREQNDQRHKQNARFPWTFQMTKLIKKDLFFTYGLGVMSGTQQKFWSSVPEGNNHWVKICQRFQRRIKQPGKPHVSWKRKHCSFLTKNCCSVHVPMLRTDLTASFLPHRCFELLITK